MPQGFKIILLPSRGHSVASSIALNHRKTTRSLDRGSSNRQTLGSVKWKNRGNNAGLLIAPSQQKVSLICGHTEPQLQSVLLFLQTVATAQCPHGHWSLINQRKNYTEHCWEVWDGSAWHMNQHLGYCWVRLYPTNGFCVSLSISNNEKDGFFHVQRACASLLSHVVWTAIKLSESYSCLALNEAHLQEQTVPSLSPSTVHTPMFLPEACV